MKIGIVEKADTGSYTQHYVLYNMNSGCVLEYRDTPTSHCVTIILIPISVPLQYVFAQVIGGRGTFLSGVQLITSLCVDIGIKLLLYQVTQCDVGVSLHSKTHPLFMLYSNGTCTQYCVYRYLNLFSLQSHSKISKNSRNLLVYI